MNSVFYSIQFIIKEIIHYIKKLLIKKLFTENNIYIHIFFYFVCSINRNLKYNGNNNQ